MYYKCEKNGRCFSHTIEYEHRLDGEMPGTGTVGCGNEHGKRADAEDEECGKDADVCRKGEGKEGDIEMQEVANPYPYAVEDVEPWAAELAERHHPVPESLQFHPCLLQQAEAEKDVYGKAQADDGAEDGTYTVTVRLRTKTEMEKAIDELKAGHESNAGAIQDLADMVAGGEA